MSQLVTQAYEEFFEKEIPYETHLEYNRRLSDFNANISLSQKKLRVHMNLNWKDIDESIQIGCIQHLLARLFKSKRNSTNIMLYNNFIKNAHLMAPRKVSDLRLTNLFDELNEQFFDAEMHQPNLVWGTASFRKLAYYNYHDDTVTVSTLFKDAPDDVLGFLLYHELLHKKHKFEHKGTRSRFHTKAFREDERKYPNYHQMEKELEKRARQGKREQTKPQSLWRFLR